MIYRSRIKKILSLLCILTMGVSIITGCSKENIDKNNIVSDIENAPFECTILDGGSQDCILLQIDDKVMMIDTGLKKNSDNILSLLKEKNIDKIDYLILTHMDKDHIGGAYDVLTSINVDTVIQADYVKESTQYNEYENALKEKNIEPIKLHENMNVSIGKANIKIYPPEEDYYEQSNDYSIIVDVDYVNQSFLFAGDAEKLRIKEYLNSDLNKEYAFLKVPHHGRMGKNTDEFLKAVNPKIAVVTCSEKEPADDEVLSILDDMGTKTYLNTNGTIIIKSNGDNISVNQ